MSRFDFRDMFGRCNASVTPDPKLADGIEVDQAAADKLAQAQKTEDIAAQIVRFVGNTLTMNAHLHGICPAFLLHTLIVAISDAALCQQGPGEQSHVVDHIRLALRHIERPNG